MRGGGLGTFGQPAARRCGASRADLPSILERVRRVTQAVGMGLDGPVSVEEFDRLRGRFTTAAAPETVRVEMCPLADSTFIEQFGQRGYRVTEFSNVMARQVSPRRDLSRAA